MMKQLSLLTLFLCCCLAGLRAATVSGTVTNSVSGAPQPNMMVTIADSVSSPAFYAFVRTDFAGAYSVTLPSYVSVGDKITVSMSDSCFTYSAVSYTYSGSSIVKNFTGCPSPTWKDLNGRFTLQGATFTTPRSFIAYIISKKYDPVVMDTTLTVIDSIPTYSTTAAFTKRYTTIPAGQLLLKVALTGMDSEYFNYPPTYYDSALQWSSARTLSAANFSSGAVTNIFMKRAVNPGGPGFIGGSVLLGANKSSGVGDPLSSRILMLVNAATNNLVAFTHSDATGKFSFPSLAYGTYRIFGDAPGKANPQLTVTLSAAKPGYNNILFEENNKRFKGQIGGLSVAGGTALSDVTVYPNPVLDEVRFSGLNTIGGGKSVVLTDITGAVISSLRFEPGTEVKVPVANLPAGVYHLQLSTEAGPASFRVVK